MPHINRIRVNNVKYNFGTQAYDDFIMKPFCHNTLYDLANGGGKSVLMLLMLQNVLPNCTLDEKQPVEKLFRTGDGSQTIHSLIEWKLDDCDVSNGYQYMTTGFCAKKATQAPVEEDKVKESASIEYFNYCIFYREYNENDIRNLPLVKDKERITYQGLRKYLKELERDNSYMVYVFDKKRDYQSFISRYGLYESEWEIIRGINKTEGHVRTYFETNYKTTRKVVEDLLIEEIIQKSLQLKSAEGEEETMSKTLLDIREKLMELAKRKKEINNYDRQMDLLSNFSVRMESLLHLYEQKDVCANELNRVYALANQGEIWSERQYTAQCEEIKNLKESTHAYQKRLEQSKVYQSQKKLTALRQIITSLSSEYERKVEEMNRMKDLLNQRESMNEYLEYLEEKQKRNEAAEALHALQNKNSGLTNEISTYVYFMKEHLEEIKDQLNHELLVLDQECETIKTSMVADKERQVRILQELAVSESFEALAKERKAELLKTLTNKKSQVGLLLLEELDLAQKENHKQRLQYEASIVTVSSKLAELEISQKQSQMAAAKIELELEQLLKAEKEEHDFLSLYAKEKVKAEQLLVAYGQKEYQSLIREIHARLKKSIQLTAQCRQEMMELTQELKQLERGEFSLDTQLLSKAKDSLMSRYAITVKTGVEYLSELGITEKVETVSRYPYLPYALILMSKEQEELSVQLPGKEFESLVIPMVSVDAVKSGKPHSMSENIQLIAKDQSILFDEKRLLVAIERLRKELHEIAKKITRLEDQEATYSEDEAYIHLFVTNSFAKFKEISQRNNETKQAIAMRNLSLQANLSANQDSVLIQNELKNSLEASKKGIEACKEKSILYSELSILSTEYEQECEKEELHRKRIAILNPEENQLMVRMSDSEQELESRKLQMRAKQQRIIDATNLWENKYRMFYVNGTYTRPDLSWEEISSKLNGALSAIESKYTDLEDKNRLINSYVQAMNRCLKSIETKGMSIAMLEEIRSKDALYVTSANDLAMLGQQVKQLTKEVFDGNERLAKLKEEGSRLEGSTEQSIASYQESFGAFAVENVEEVDHLAFMNEAKEKIVLIQQKEKQLSEGLQNLSKEKEQFSSIAKDIKRMIPSITVTNKPEALNVVSLVKVNELARLKEQLERQWYKLEKDLRGKEEEFTQNKQKTREALIALNAVGLAQEIQSSVKFTSNREETIGLIHNLSQVNQCLQLEKDRITSGIEDMIHIKDNFENQCLQRCMHIRAELERLPKLSRITLEGELIPMISLSIPYVKEEFYKEKMSRYIDEVVAGADAFADHYDRLKYIRTALSLKKLFSVIVTDMNAIKLSLYKRERIKDQSRHLRYEEAVGSTGQSQGIYTQFLIAIITYISNINSRRGDSVGLRKVIFIDNPFGAAKDIYIWEPIFELLEQNQVQMIVPARGTTPAITSRFDVNYILGQKLIDNRQQTVVVDYHSSVKARETEFAPLKYEQASFDLFES